MTELQFADEVLDRLQDLVANCRLDRIRALVAERRNAHRGRPVGRLGALPDVPALCRARVRKLSEETLDLANGLLDLQIFVYD